MNATAARNEPQTKQQRRDVITQETRRVAQERGMEAQEGCEFLAYLDGAEALMEWAATTVLVERGADSVPSLLEGLVHPNGKIRATCALLLDHVADDRCVAPLLYAIRHDSLEAVRRCALHSLICDGCKSCPLTVDVVSALIEVATQDRSLAVRRRAVFYLSQQHPDVRVRPFLTALRARETDVVLLRRAEYAWQRHRIPASA